MKTNNPESGFNSDRKIRQYAHGLLLETPFVTSSTDCWAIRAKIRQKRPSWWPQRRNRKQKYGGDLKNELFDPSFLFTPSDTFSLGRTILLQYKTLETDRQMDRQTTYCTIGSTDSTVGQKAKGRNAAQCTSSAKPKSQTKLRPCPTLSLSERYLCAITASL